MAKFYRGLYEKYNSQSHADGIYFATDKGIIRMNGVDYIGPLANEDVVKNITLDVENNQFVVTYLKDTANPQRIDLLTILPDAVAASGDSEGSRGLLSAKDKTFIDMLNYNVNAGNMFLSPDQAETIAKVKAGDYTNKIETVSGNILSQNGTDISATVALSYDEKTKRIKLLGKDNADLGSVDATPFIKDGMLEDVEVVTIEADDQGRVPEGLIAGQKYIRFVWNINDGMYSYGQELKVDYIPVSDLAKTYTPGTAITISESNEIGVNIANSTETQTNYLVNGSNGLKVSEMGANVTTTKQPIQVVGGPLADDLKDIFPDNIIPTGTSVETILMKMICKEIFPTASTSQGTLSASMTLTTLAFDPTDATVEVGTKVTTNALTASGSTSSTAPAKISGLTNGYSLTENGDKVTGNITFNVTDVTEATNTQKITLTYSGFTETAPNAVSAATSVTMPAQTLVVREGECKVTANASGSKFTATSPAVTQSYYNISNVNTRRSETKTISTKSLSATASKSTNDSVTGVYKYFAGYYDFASNQNVVDVFTSDIIRGLTTHTGDITKDGTTTLVGTTSVTSNGKSIVIAVPSKYKLATFQNDLGGSELANFSKTGTVAVANPTNTAFTTNYTVYVWPVAGGATITYKNVTITKA